MAATLFPVKGQAWEFNYGVLSSATGNLITGGLTSISVTVSKDGGNFAAIAGTATEIQTSGVLRIVPSAADMTGSCLTFIVLVGNANAMLPPVHVMTLDLTETPDHWMDQANKRLEQGVLQTASYLLNKTTLNSASGAVVVRNAADTADYLTGTDSNAGGVVTKGKLG